MANSLTREVLGERLDAINERDEHREGCLDVLRRGHVDTRESERVEWMAVDALRTAIAEGQMPDGLSLTAVLYALQFAEL